MYRRNRRHSLGFTLTELAIVLAVVGVLAAGLYNLLSGASEQVRDQSAASQQEQLLSAVKAFLGSPQGQSYMTANTLSPAAGGCGTGVAPALSCTMGSNFALPLPTTTACADFPADANWSTFCTFLPPGFTSTTTNAYTQTFSIRIQRDATTLAGQAPSTYSYIVLTLGGQVIPDTSGARIASLIGGDGGFVYTNNVCGAPTGNWACGAFGGWSSTLSGGGSIGFAASVSGKIASRTYVSPQQNSFFSWLARVPISGDTNFTLNSMTTPEYIGGTPASFSNELDMGAYMPPPGGMLPSGGGTFNLQSGVFNFTYAAPLAVAGALGGKMNVQGGTIDLSGGTMVDTNVSPPGPGSIIPIDIDTSLAPLAHPFLVNLGIDGTVVSTSPAINIFTLCSQDPTAAANGGPPTSPTGSCAAGLQANADVSVGGELTANSLFAKTFIYNSSDLRLKTNIKPMADALDKIMRLAPVTFNFRAGNQKGLGFIAQDIEKIYPELVAENPNGMKSVNYDGLIAPLVAAVQELKEQNNELRSQMRAQELREDALEQKLKAAQSK